MSDPAEAAFRRYYGHVFRYVRRRSGSDADAEDIAQAVFSDAVRGLQESETEATPVLAWLYRVARNRLIDEWRRADSVPAPVLSFDEARLSHQSTAEYGVDLARTLAAGLASLPSEQRDVVVMKLVEGRRFAEIATRTGASEGACRMRLNRALRTLRAYLEEEGLRP